MNLQDLGAIGDLIGGIAVVLSVLYLAAQIRHGLSGYRSMVTQEVTNHFSRLQLEIASDPELFSVWYRVQRGEPLNEDEVVRATQILSAYMIAFENLFFQHKSGMLDYEPWAVRRRIMANMISSPVAQVWWKGQGRAMHPTLFAEEVEAAVAEYRSRN